MATDANILALIQDPAFMTEGDTLCAVNSQWEQLTGYRAEQTLGQPLHQFFAPDHHEWLETILQSAQRGDFPTPISYRLRLLDSNRMPHWVSLRLQGTATGLLGIMRRTSKSAHSGTYQRDQILQAIRTISRNLLQSDHYFSVIPNALEQLGQAMQASTARLYRRSVNAEGYIVVTCVAEWYAGPHVPRPLLDIQSPITINPVIDIVGQRFLDESYAIWHRDYSDHPGLQFLLRQMQAVSMLTVPIRIVDDHWGNIELSSTNPGMVWEAPLRSSLNVAADVIAAAIQRDRDHKKKHQQADILAAVAEAANDFLLSQSWQERIPHLLQSLAEAADVTRIYIFRRNLPDAPDYISFFEQYSKYPEQGLNSERYTRFPLVRYFPRWADRFRRGVPLVAITSELPTHERERFEGLGIKSFLVMPIMVDNVWWGTISFDDKFEARIWTAEEVSALATAASIIGSAIRRQQSEEALSTYANQLEERNQALDIFSSLIAHDLKAPLSTMIGMLDKLLSTPDEDHSNHTIENLQRMLVLGTDMHSMIDQLLWLAKIRTKPEAKLVETDFALDVALNRFQERIQNNKIQIERQALPLLMGHQHWVQEVFANLISNAIKYIGFDNPQPTIRIFAIDEANADGQDLARICVADNGMGISQDKQNMIFDFLKRGSTKIEGNGLGLALVRQMVEKMDGSVGFSSFEGHGTTFWFILAKAAPYESPFL